MNIFKVPKTTIFFILLTGLPIVAQSKPNDYSRIAETHDDISVMSEISNMIYFRDYHCSSPGENCELKGEVSKHIIKDVWDKEINVTLRVSMGDNKPCQSIRYRLMYLAIPTLGHGFFANENNASPGTLIGKVYESKTMAFGMNWGVTGELGPQFSGWVDIEEFDKSDSCRFNRN